MRDYTAVSKSPVKNGDWQKKLSPEYAKKTGKKAANLYEEGDLMNSLVIKRSGNKLTFTVDDDQQAKADGHNNFSGRSSLPTRAFIPKEDQGFRGAIEQGIRDIIKEFK